STRAQDQAGNMSEWSAERCTDVPLDDQNLQTDGNWSRGSARSFFLGTFMKTTKSGATLSAPDAAVREIHVVAQRCPSCGKVAVSLNGQRIATLSLKAKRTLDRQVIRVKRFTSLRTGDIDLIVISNKAPVKIDGLVLSVR
ncbi:MAG: hypothetical protein QOK47_377, partial [Actinomycetota bacterium]|nr:hypothetical protein [Actinomycetota bacterium]